MRLRLVHRGSFSKNEVTLFEEAMKANKDVELGPNDCVLLVSKNGKQLKFVRRARPLNYESPAKAEKATTIVSSELYRITGTGSWNPMMLSNYASELNIELEGIKRFESYYRSFREGSS